MYTKPGDVVLDPTISSGTTLVEAKLLEFGLHRA
jgi:DNA modification methylase